MRLEYKLSVRPSRVSKIEVVDPPPKRRPPRVTCLLALAHRFEDLVRRGEVKDYADLARLGHVSRARVSQILKLLTLAPSIQEHLLGLPPRAATEYSFSERDLREVVREFNWDHQRLVFELVIARRGASPK